MSDGAALESVALTSAELRRLAGRFATGVTIVTTAGAGTVHGITVNAFATVSLEPLLVVVAVDRGTRMHGLLEETGVYAVSVLAAGQERISRWFATPGRAAGAGQFEDVPCDAAPVTGSPVVRGCAAWFDCRVAAAHRAGDHTLFVAEVAGMGGGAEADALVFHGGGYHSVPNSRSPKSPSPGTM